MYVILLTGSENKREIIKQSFALSLAKKQEQYFHAASHFVHQVAEPAYENNIMPP